MKLLMRIVCGLGRSGGGLINQERSLFQQARRSSIHVVPTPSRRHMVTTAVTCPKEKETSGQGPALTPAGPAADDTRWMLLNRWCCATNSTAVDVVANADAKTVAETHTSSSRPLRVSLSRAAPPATSYLCFDDRAGHAPTSEEGGGGGGKWSRDDKGFREAVVAAHGDSVLLRFSGDYFVYKAAAGQPTSLSLLPPCRDPMYKWEYDGKHDDGEVYRTERELRQMDTGLLRCAGGGGEFLVAQLQVAYKKPFDTAELCVFRHGRPYWELKDAVPIVHHDGGGRHSLGRWQELNAAVPAGNRFLCWVSYDHSTLLVCDMMAEEGNTKLRYVPLPVKPVPPKEDEKDWGFEYDDEDQLYWQHYRSIGAVPPQGTDTAAVRFVSIDRRCCCGGPVIRSDCEHSSSLFTVTTWTLALPTTTGKDEDEPMTWVKEGVLDCEEFWALLAGINKGLPRRPWPTCPVVSSENPDVVFFVVAECEDGRAQQNICALEIDMRRKTLISVVPCPPYPAGLYYGTHLPAKLQS